MIVTLLKNSAFRIAAILILALVIMNIAIFSDGHAANFYSTQTLSDNFDKVIGKEPYGELHGELATVGYQPAYIR